MIISLDKVIYLIISFTFKCFCDIWLFIIGTKLRWLPRSFCHAWLEWSWSPWSVSVVLGKESKYIVHWARTLFRSIYLIIFSENAITQMLSDKLSSEHVTVLVARNEIDERIVHVDFTLLRVSFRFHICFLRLLFGCFNFDRFWNLFCIKRFDSLLLLIMSI